MEIPLFPLRTVLYPGGPLPLRIFEQRYLAMISRCLREDGPFGVVLIREGGEVGPATTHDIGTLARISDWYQGSDGLLGVTATGTQRFRKMAERRLEDGLLVSEVELLPEPAAQPLPEAYRPLAKVLEAVIGDLGRLYENLEKRYDDAGWVGYRFAEILPIPPEQKQSCLENDDPLTRLESMRAVLETIRS
jgi:Lon protease-like protein